jgi:predicted GIY-YIG superfamily endonuclease
METTISKSEINVNLIELNGMYFVYYLLLSDRVVYVGSSKGIYKRLKEHKYQKQFDTIKLVSFDSARNCKRFERYEIQRLKPEYNGNTKGNFIEPQLNCNKGKNIISIDDKIKLVNNLQRN